MKTSDFRPTLKAHEMALYLYSNVLFQAYYFVFLFTSIDGLVFLHNSSPTRSRSNTNQITYARIINQLTIEGVKPSHEPVIRNTGCQFSSGIDNILCINPRACKRLRILHEIESYMS